jgi:hypothetical protein
MAPYIPKGMQETGTAMHHAGSGGVSRTTCRARSARSPSSAWPVMPATGCANGHGHWVVDLILVNAQHDVRRYFVQRLHKE